MEAKLCGNYFINHPMWRGEASYTCKGCKKFKPINKKEKYVDKKGNVNCSNFKEVV